ncbi:hypothetical protein, partial [Actinomadura livida]|uniref:hypothetical protein n=1 Tax=Actinomadura livida TaxID=79909 RepID=UPI0031DEE286
AVRHAAGAAAALVTDLTGSAVARTARDLALRTASRAATAAIEAVLRELLRDALKLAMQDTLRGIVADVARDVVVDVAKTTWTTATRPAPGAGPRVAAAVIVEETVEDAPAGRTRTTDVWAQVTTGETPEAGRDVLGGEGPSRPADDTNGK